MAARSLTRAGVIEEIYDAALNRGRWQSVLRGIADSFDASVGVLMSHDRLAPDNDIHVHVRNPQDIQQRYMQHYFLEADIWYQIARKNWPQREVIIGEEHISDRELKQTDFYHDILKPADAGQQLSGSIEANQRYTRAIALSRPLSSPRFTQADKQAMAELLVHLKRAFAIHEQLSLTGNEQHLLGRMLSMTRRAALLCRENGELVFCNESAERILVRADGLGLSAQRLQCTQRRDTDALYALFKNIRQLGSATLRLQRADAVSPYELMIFRIDNRRHDITGNDLLIGLFINSSEQRQQSSAELLAGFYKLTKAEVAIAQLLYEGLSPVQIARRKGVKTSTVRTQLHRIYDKTGSRNQAQLIRLMAENIACHAGSGLLN